MSASDGRGGPITTGSGSRGPSQSLAALEKHGTHAAAIVVTIAFILPVFVISRLRMIEHVIECCLLLVRGGIAVLVCPLLPCTAMLLTLAGSAEKCRIDSFASLRQLPGHRQISE